MDFGAILLGVILTAFAYMLFPLIRLLINNGRFDKQRAQKIALWNSIVVGSVFFIVTCVNDPGTLWMPSAAFLYYWINYAILSNREKPQNDDPHLTINHAVQQKIQFCHYCGAQAIEDAPFCNECGNRIANTNEHAPQFLKCNKCNHIIPQNSKFCPFCSSPLSFTDIAEKQNKNESLLKYAFIFIEKGMFDRAEQYLKIVLEQNPDEAQAYLGLLMIDLGINHQEDLPEQDEPFDQNPNFIKAIQLGDTALVRTLSNYAQLHHGYSQYETQYQKAVGLINNAEGVEDYYQAMLLLQQFGDYKNSNELLDQCIQECEKTYQLAIDLKDSKDTNDLAFAIYLLNKIPDWRHAQDWIAKLQQKRVKQNRNIGIFIVTILIMFLILIGVSISSI